VILVVTLILGLNANESLCLDEIVIGYRSASRPFAIRSQSIPPPQQDLDSLNTFSQGVVTWRCQFEKDINIDLFGNSPTFTHFTPLSRKVGFYAKLNYSRTLNIMTITLTLLLIYTG
jgi:hypothetical protein